MPTLIAHEIKLVYTKFIRFTTKQLAVIRRNNAIRIQNNFRYFLEAPYKQNIENIRNSVNNTR